MQVSILRLVCLIFVFAFPSTVYAQSSTPSKVSGWKVSCGVDKGALKKSRRDYVFRPSRNHCDPEFADSPWQWKQRTEIFSKHYSPKLKGRYMFETIVAMTSPSRQKFDIFQMHDGRKACAPPLKVEWSSNNQVSLVSSYKVTGKGEEHCIKNNITTANFQRGSILPRDGSEHRLQVILNFDGTGAFTVVVGVDGKRAIEGGYDPNLSRGVVRSVTGIRMNSPRVDGPKKLYFKHGVYSKNPFDFVLHSKAMRMVRIK